MVAAANTVTAVRQATTIVTVSAWAFVVPLYDFTDVDDASPAFETVTGCIGWQAWGWNPGAQAWERLGDVVDTRGEAWTSAYAHNMEAADRMGIVTAATGGRA